MTPTDPSSSCSAGSAVQDRWNGGFATVTNQSYNARLAAGRSTTSGFRGAGNGSGVTVTCAGS